MVKRIFLEYLEGYSYNIIRKGLEADGIKTAACKTKLVATTLHKILRNEKYIGDALLQKTVTTDFGLSLFCVKIFYILCFTPFFFAL